MSALAALLAAAAVLLGRSRRPSLPARPPDRVRGPARAVPPASLPPRRAPLLAGLGAAAGVGLLAPGWLVVAALPAGLLAWDRVRRMEPRALVRHREAVAAELPHLVDLLGAMVRSGASPDRAAQAVTRVLSSDTRAELQPYLGRLELGADPTQVWHELGGHRELGRLGTTLHRAAVSGASVVGSLQRLADDLRATQRAEVTARVRKVEVAATGPLGACLLPAFVLVGVVPLVAGSLQSLTLA